MSAPLNYTPQITMAMESISRDHQRLVALAEEIQSIGKQVEGTSLGMMVSTLVQKVGEWLGNMDQMNSSGVAFVRAGNDSYDQMMSVDRQGSTFFV